MFENLVKPNWYPGDEAWLLLNKLWVPVFALFTIVGLIILYKVIKGDWDKKIAIPFILNIIGVVLVPVVTFQVQTLIGGFWVTLLLTLSAIAQTYMITKYSRILAILCAPYIIWTIPIIILYIELIRLNVM